MKKLKINGNSILLIITIVLFVVMYGAGCIIYADKGFTHLQTFLNVLINNAGLICVACGVTCVMLTGGSDISVGSLVAMDCMFLAVGMEHWGMKSPVGRLADLGRDDRHKEHGERAARAAHDVRCVADGDERKQDHRRRLERVCDRDRHRGADHGGSHTTDSICSPARGNHGITQKSDIELCAQGVQNGAHKQGTEQTLRHCAHRVNEIALYGEHDVLAPEKFFDFVHCSFLFVSLYLYAMSRQCSSTP